MTDGQKDASEREDAPASERWDDELIPGHEYDGIREYDNPIPGWLSLIFSGTVVWSLFYLVAINLGYIGDYEDQLEEGQRALTQLRQQAASDKKEITEELLASATDDSKRVQNGETLFKENCANCHQNNGSGKIGPNLTDRHWIHGGSLTSIYATIANGVNGKGMPAWKDRLSQDEQIDLVAYVDNLERVPPPEGKKPEGEKYTPDDE